MNKYQFIGTILYWIFYVLNKTLRVQIISFPEYQPDKQYLSGFWHGKQLLPGLRLRKLHQNRLAVLVSPSKDGEILSTLLKKIGYEIVRGSSRRDNVKGSLALMEKIKNGCSFGFAIDGPLGPIYKVKPGAVYMSQRFGVDIVPVGSAYSRKWRFEKAWDKFEIPKPFCKAVLYLGEPLHVPKDADLTKINEELERRIHEAEKKAEELLVDVAKR